MYNKPVFDAPSDGPVKAHTDPHTKANVQAHIEAHGLSPELIERAVETLCNMVGWSSRRLEKLERRLADAVAAERIAANVAAGLRAELDRLRARGRGGEGGSGELPAPLLDPDLSIT